MEARSIRKNSKRENTTRTNEEINTAFQEHLNTLNDHMMTLADHMQNLVSTLST